MNPIQKYKNDSGLTWPVIAANLGFSLQYMYHLKRMKGEGWRRMTVDSYLRLAEAGIDMALSETDDTQAASTTSS